jgi:hypothetical protein
MDLDKNKQCCGTCKNWQGKREVCEDQICRVSPSARGLCEKLNAQKPPSGGCGDNWTSLGEEQDG